MKRLDVLAAVGLAVAVLLLTSAASGRLSSHCQWIKWKAARWIAEHSERKTGDVHIVVRDIESQAPIEEFSYFVFRSGFSLYFTRDKTEWLRARNKRGEATVRLPGGKQVRLLAVRVPGYRDCAFSEPEPGDKIVFSLSPAGGERPSRSHRVGPDTNGRLLLVGGT